MSASESRSALITRRRLAALTAAGGSAFVLSACGTDADPNVDKSDTLLLGYIRELQSLLADGYEHASPGNLPKDLASAFAPQAKATLADIDKALDELGAQPPQATFSANLDVGAVEDLEPFLIGVVNAVVPDLSTEALRLLAYQASSSSAGRIAAVNQDAGKDPAPTAFVLGELPPGFEGVQP